MRTLVALFLVLLPSAALGQITETKITSDADSLFGFSVSAASWEPLQDLVDPLVAIGHPGANGSVGSVQVFLKSGTWSSVQGPVDSPETNPGLDNFGYSVSLDASRGLEEMRLAVGAYAAGPGFQGKAYVYDVNGTGAGSVTFDRQIDSPSSFIFGFFGQQVAVYGDQLIAGGWNILSGGSAYSYQHDGSDWVGPDTLQADNPAPGDDFSFALDMYGNRAAFGARATDHSGVTDAGTVYVFDRDGSEWLQSASLISDAPSESEEFAMQVALSEDDLIVSSAGSDSERGAVLVFNWSGSEWASSGRVIAADGQAGDRFGASVDVQANLLVVGAPGHADGAGAVYVFARLAGPPVSWTQIAKLTASDGAADDGFGSAVAVFGRTVVVGAPYADTNEVNAGAAYIYQGAFAVANEPVADVPSDFRLEQNYPNPFNPSTTIRFALPIRSNAVLEVSDVLGRVVSVLADETLEAGEHEFTFDASHLPSGVYTYRLSTVDRVASRTLVLLR